MTTYKKHRKKVIITAMIFFAIGLFFGLFLVFNNSHSSTGNSLKDMEDTKLVTKIIDGDTVIVEGGDSVRLLGIDADERGYPCYSPAKERLEELVLNEEVYLEAGKEDKDQYERYLRYLILDGENINLKLVKEGLAIARFSPENTKYREEIIDAEKEAKENKIGCKWRDSQTKETEEEIDTSSSSINDTINACNANNYIGKEKTFKGEIVGGYKSDSNTVFLNFGEPYPDQCFVAVIFSSDLDNFQKNPSYFYEGKTVKIKGMIEEYKGKPEIILKDSSQIEIIKN